MVKRKRVVRKTNEFQKIEKGVEKEVRDAEKWMVERRKFFIKLGLIIIFILIILLLANFF